MMQTTNYMTHNVQHLLSRLLIITLAPLPPPSQIPHDPYDNILHWVWLQFYVKLISGRSMTVHNFARSKLPQQNMLNNVRLFCHALILGSSTSIDKRQSIQKCAYHMG